MKKEGKKEEAAQLISICDEEKGEGGEKILSSST